MNKKRLIAPIIVTVILVAYFIFYIFIILSISSPFLLKLIFGIILLCLIGVSVYVLFERIKEIRSGYEDDISKY